MAPPPPAGPAPGRPLVVWLLQDGKAGHQNQALALLEALQSLQPLAIQPLPLPPRPWPGQALLTALAAARRRPRPDLVVGAGHGSHLALLVLAAWQRCPSLVLMRPSLPLRCFDRVVAPGHDLQGLPPAPRLLASFGPLCRRAPPAPSGSSDWLPHTLVLLGGPSRHHRFDLAGLQGQLAALLAADPDPAGWCLVASRRTPTAALPQLGQGLGLAPRQLLPWRQCPPGWLAAALARRPLVWVGEDSLSMLFEAVSAGCRVGVLSMPRRRCRWRQGASLERLVAEGYVLPLAPDRPLPDLARFQPPPPPAEAERLAALLLPWLQGVRR